MKAAIAAHKLIAVIVAAVIVAAAVIGAVNFIQYQQEQEAIQFQAWSKADTAYSNIYYQPPEIKKAFFFYLVDDDFGNAVPRADLDKMEPGLLDALIAAYNKDPSCEKHLSAEDARWGLTDGMLEVLGSKSEQGGQNSALYAFIVWCNEDADLVYRGKLIDTDGTVHSAGETANIASFTSNYSYVDAQNSDKVNYQFRWEWNEQHPEDPR